MKDPSVLTYGEAENAVAIIDCVGDWPGDDDRLRDHLQGRKGVYDIVINLGRALEEVVTQDAFDAKEDRSAGWDHYDWYLTTEAIAEKIAAITDKWDIPVTDEQLEDFVRGCLKE